MRRSFLRLPLVVFVAGALLAVACAGPQVARPTGQDQGPPVANRMDCGQIYGTAYHSPEERGWFEGNCMSWPAFSAADPAPAQVPSAPDAACLSIAGRPYSSDQERQWFLANCIGRVPLPGAPGSPAPQAAAGPDRTNCNEIRGTAYRSDSERAWFLQNCPAAPAPAPAPAQQPVASNAPAGIGTAPQFAPQQRPGPLGQLVPAR